MKIIPVLDYGETEPVRTGTANIYCCVAFPSVQAGVRSCSLLPQPGAVFFAGAFPSTFAPLERLAPNRRVKAGMAQKKTVQGFKLTCLALPCLSSAAGGVQWV